MPVDRGTCMNESTIFDGCMLQMSKQLCGEFQQHFTVLFRVHGVSGMKMDFTSDLSSFPSQRCGVV